MSSCSFLLVLPFVGVINSPTDWRKEIRDTWNLFGGAKLFGICSIGIAISAFAEAHREITTEWVGDHLERVFATGLFVLGASVIGAALGLVGATREFRGGAAFWLGVVGALANMELPICVTVIAL